ncbi:AAA family ATPase [Schaalia sp. 19OD2882]|uniref:AAA family ATPase n=1 Tax=Schaalia sp. 19OD2882 TaxID=2794089 RepID=UPI001C1EC141|nr:AAA family ATPase [Schaalia sp. 19OD2882]QWW20315.1 AAA family ATPase [Schaalia sp. 19OD2882]
MSGPVHAVALLADAEVEGAIVAAIGRHPGVLEVVRRCADLAEVVAAVRAGTADLVCIDADDPDLDARVVEDLLLAGAGVVLLVDGRNPSALALGADAVIPSRATDQIIEALLALVRGDRALRALGSRGIPAAPLPEELDFPRPGQEITPGPGGKLVAVWGTSGAPGRSTSALAVARWASHAGKTVVVDADTLNPSLAHMLSLPVDPSGLGALSRVAGRGGVSPADVNRVVHTLDDGFSVLTGLGVPQRWKEVGPAALVDVLRAARRVAHTVVVDLPAVNLDPVEERSLHQGTRDETTAAVLREADTVLMVARGDAVGLHRLSLTHEWWSNQGFSARLVVCVNRCSSAAAGPRWPNAIRAALAPFLDGHLVHLVPEDEAVPDALLRGRTVVDNAREAPASRAWAELAATVVQGM